MHGMFKGDGRHDDSHLQRRCQQAAWGFPLRKNLGQPRMADILGQPERCIGCPGAVRVHNGAAQIFTLLGGQFQPRQFTHGEQNYGMGVHFSQSENHPLFARNLGLRYNTVISSHNFFQFLEETARFL